MTEWPALPRMMKTGPSKALVIRINLVFLAFFLIVYVALLLRPSSSSLYEEHAASLVRCSMGDCHHKVEHGVKMKAVLEEPQPRQVRSPGNRTKIGVPGLLKRMGRGVRKMAMVNMDEDDVSGWKAQWETVPVRFHKVSEYFEWKHLFPEWIDEEEENEGPSCPEIPMPDFEAEEKVDMVVAKLPCRYPEEGWGRDVFRLQVHLVAANMAVKRGRRDRGGTTKVLLYSKCRPMIELFRCDDLQKKEGDWWLYEPDMRRLEQKVSLPLGSCKLALPLWEQGIDQVYDYDARNMKTGRRESEKREAYATVLHSSESYVCGAITLAQSLLKTGTKRDLVMLLDDSISRPKREALAAAGWKIRIIKRIRNPKAEKGTYNEYNYSKFRLWQLTDYDKVIFIDADIIVLRNLDLLFRFPQMSATGNDGSIFNSGVMVIEPSACTFRLFMKSRNDVVSYNGGDQGFLNEIFVWWHRLPRRMNYLKNFWSNTTLEASVKNQLFAADPPKLYAIHYLGWKPWLCYRDYDCNWDVLDQRVYASDVAHRTWWKLHDAMEPRLQNLCLLTRQRRTELNWERRRAGKMDLPDGHWKINITDPRRKHIIENL